MTFNPFKVRPYELNLLREQDLADLVTAGVCEGYWVEYKSSFPDNAKIAKSIASLANTYGGWYFIGIEADRVGNAAQNLVGFSLDEIPTPIDKVREVIKSHVDPVPEFYAAVVTLSSRRAILVIHVPDGQETPFVHRDGRIYRRVADSSDPVAEANRYAVDRLVEQGRSVSEQFVQFCQDERVSSANDEAIWVNIYISPYPLVESVFADDDTFAARADRYRELSLQPSSIGLPGGGEMGTANIPLWTAQSTTCSVILRQPNPPSAITSSLEAELYFDGRGKFFIPVEYMRTGDPHMRATLTSDRLRNWLTSLVQENEDAGFLRTVRLDKLWPIIMTLLSYYQHWYSQEIAPIGAHNSQFRVAVQIKNVADALAILDSDRYVAHVMKYGLPLINRHSIHWPRNATVPAIVDVAHNPLWTLINGIVMVEMGLPETMIEVAHEVAFPSRR